MIVIATIKKIELRECLKAMYYKKYKHFWVSQCLLNIGGWMEYMSEIWLIYSFAHSALMLGILGVLQSAPILVFSVFAGVLVDKIPRKKIIIVTTLFNMFLSLTVALLIWLNILKEWHLFLIVSFWGLSSAMELPAKQAFINDVVNREDISNAIALYSSIDNIGRMIGPALAGFVVSAFGVMFCFIIYAVLNLPMLFMLLKYKTVSDLAIEKRNIFADIKEGFKYVLKTNVLNKSILSAVFVGIFEFNFSLLIPLFAYNVFNLDDAGVSIFMTILGAGCIAGSIVTIIKSNSQKTINQLFITASILSLLYILTGINTNYYLSLLLFALSGALCIIFFTNVNSLIIINTEKQYTGRILSFYSLVYMGATPLGNMFCGVVSDKLGIQMCFVICGLSTLLFMPFLYLKGKRNAVVSISDKE